MSTTPAFDPTKTEYATQSTPQEMLGDTAVSHTLSPELRAEIDGIKDAALAELARTGNLPAEHVPDAAPLSPEDRAAVDAVKTEVLARDQTT